MERPPSLCRVGVLSAGKRPNVWLAGLVRVPCRNPSKVASSRCRKEIAYKLRQVNATLFVDVQTCQAPDFRTNLPQGMGQSARPSADIDHVQGIVLKLVQDVSRIRPHKICGLNRPTY